MSAGLVCVHLASQQCILLERAGPHVAGRAPQCGCECAHDRIRLRQNRNVAAVLAALAGPAAGVSTNSNPRRRNSVGNLYLDRGHLQLGTLSACWATNRAASDTRLDGESWSYGAGPALGACFRTGRWRRWYFLRPSMSPIL
jgi:hypothetical protein